MSNQYYNMFGTGLGNQHQYGSQYVPSASPVQPIQPVQPIAPVYSGQYGTTPQYGTQQQNNPGFIVVHDENEAMDSKYPMNTPLFNEMEDIFYFKTLGPDNIHTVLKKARFVWEDDGVVDVPLIEQKGTTYGESPKNDEIESLKKMVQDLSGQVTALGDILLEQSTDDKTTSRSSATKKTSSNK